MRAPLIAAAGSAALIAAVVVGCDPSTTGGATTTPAAKEVVLYCSLDEPFSRFIEQDFEAKTGITVQFLTDDEVDKSVGLRGKLMAEHQSGTTRCDVFWNNEPGNSEVLRQAGVLQPYKSPAAAGIPDNQMFRDADGFWTGFAARVRVLIVNTDLVKGDGPSSFDDIFADKYKHLKRAIALPVAGTTATHAAALYERWGAERAKAYFQKIKDAGVIIATGNAHVMNMVADGEVAFGWTDSDDVHVAVQKGKPVKLVYPDQGADGRGTLVLANTVMMIKGAPHPDAAKKLIDYILSTAIEERLANGDSVQMPLHPGVTVPDPAPAGFQFDHTKLKRFDFDLRKAGALLPKVIEEMKQLFQR